MTIIMKQSGSIAIGLIENLRTGIFLFFYADCREHAHICEVV